MNPGSLTPEHMHNGITYVWARISRTKEEAAESGPKEHPSSKLESFTIELEVNAFCYGASPLRLSVLCLVRLEG